jgi:1-acyl-sn-glycerol-3-phosphate acyltransferase
VPIQPVRIRGAREALPRGSARIRRSRITVTVGPPIRLTLQELEGAKGKTDYDQIAKRIMAAIEAL